MPRPAANKMAADDPSLLPSDDEDDDFVLSDAASDSSDSDSEDEDGNKKKKEKSTGKAGEVAVKEPVMTKEAVDDLWASFNAADDDPYAAPKASTSAVPSTSEVEPTKMNASEKKERKKVKIQVEYQFVGETVVQDKEVWSDSPEAIAFFSKQQHVKPLPLSAPVPSTATATATSTNPNPLDAETLFGPSTSSSLPPPIPSHSEPSQSTSKPLPQPPTANASKKRKATGGLNALAAELGVKPQKLNTLEKSKLDWNKYVTKESLEDDLTKARKDGYLEKQDFLMRTEERREEGLEGLKKGGRR